MLKMSFSQEELERALNEDPWLRHLVRDRWFAFPVFNSASVQDDPVHSTAKTQPIDWTRWPQSESRDS
jgi:hypothetical protein